MIIIEERITVTAVIDPGTMKPQGRTTIDQPITTGEEIMEDTINKITITMVEVMKGTVEIIQTEIIQIEIVSITISKILTKTPEDQHTTITCAVSITAEEMQRTCDIANQGVDTINQEYVMRI